MSYPEKFRNLIELREEQVDVPDYVWLAYAVCAVAQDSCAWQGWIIEAACKQREGLPEEFVKADDDQICPDCGKVLFRTEVEKQFRLNPNAGPKITFPTTRLPITYTKSKSVTKTKKKK